jgi:sec-independent protein translocase protein TatA
MNEIKEVILMFGNIGPWEIGFILIIVLIIFGPGKLPQLGESIGKAIKGFKQARDEDAELDKAKQKQI